MSEAPQRGQFRPGKSVAPRRDPGQPKPPTPKPRRVAIDPDDREQIEDLFRIVLRALPTIGPTHRDYCDALQVALQAWPTPLCRRQPATPARRQRRRPDVSEQWRNWRDVRADVTDALDEQSVDNAKKKMSGPCIRGPRGWWCSRPRGHDGACPLRPKWWNLRWRMKAPR